MVTAAGPGGAVGGIEERVEFWFGEERDERTVVALGRDREHSLDQRGLLGVAQRAVAKQRADRGQPQVAGAGTAATRCLEMIEERADHGGVEILERELG